MNAPSDPEIKEIADPSTDTGTTTPSPPPIASTQPAPPDEAPIADLRGKPVIVKPITASMRTYEVLKHCMRAFGGRLLSNFYRILEQVHAEGIPTVIAVAGPLTVSRQHYAWFIPWLKMNNTAYITVTDAICYHDGHDILKKPGAASVIYETLIEGLDKEYGEAAIIRVTDCGFDEEVLFDTDRMISAILLQPEFQKKMSGVEFRHLLGMWYGKLERAVGAEPGLLSTCAELGIPVFCGSPGDGSAYLNAMKLRAMRDLNLIPKFDFEIDIHAEVMESCSYHLHCLRTGQQKLAAVILGGGVPKNFSLQPEPALSQILLLDEIRGYDFDVQIVGAQVTDGSLSSCKPAEAHTWGKVSVEALASSTESINGADYSQLMPLVVHALLQKQRDVIAAGTHALHGVASGHGFLRDEPYRLYDQRDALMAALMDEVRAKGPQLLESIQFPLVQGMAGG